MILTLIIIGYSIYWLIEAFHDDELRKIGNTALQIVPRKDDTTHSIKTWHRLDWFGHVVLAALVSFSAMDCNWDILASMIMIACLRILILNLVGNLIANRDPFYLGENKFDKMFRKIPILFYICTVIVLAASIAYIIIT